MRKSGDGGPDDVDDADDVPRLPLISWEDPNGVTHACPQSTNHPRDYDLCCHLPAQWLGVSPTHVVISFQSAIARQEQKMPTCLRCVLVFEGFT